jgi:hypothetical protein
MELYVVHGIAIEIHEFMNKKLARMIFVGAICTCIEGHFQCF